MITGLLVRANLCNLRVEVGFLMSTTKPWVFGYPLDMFTFIKTFTIKMKDRNSMPELLNSTIVMQLRNALNGQVTGSPET